MIIAEIGISLRELERASRPPDSDDPTTTDSSPRPGRPGSIREQKGRYERNFGGVSLDASASSSSDRGTAESAVKLSADCRAISGKLQLLRKESEGRKVLKSGRRAPRVPSLTCAPPAVSVHSDATPTVREDDEYRRNREGPRRRVHDRRRDRLRLPSHDVVGVLASTDTAVAAHGRPSRSGTWAVGPGPAQPNLIHGAAAPGDFCEFYEFADEDSARLFERGEVWRRIDDARRAILPDDVSERASWHQRV